VTPGQIDRHVLDRHLIALRQALAALRRHAGVSPQSLRADSDLRWIVERGLQLCAQNALDISSHIASAAGLDPATYGSSIDCLVEANVLPAQFGERFRGVAGFRNVLVHGYLDVDLDLIAGLLRESLDDFEEFASYVEVAEGGEDLMRLHDFWEIVERTKRYTREETEEALIAELRKYTIEDVEKFEARYVERYRNIPQGLFADLRRTALGYCSDDTLHCFCNGIIAEGRTAYAEITATPTIETLRKHFKDFTRISFEGYSSAASRVLSRRKTARSS